MSIFQYFLLVGSVLSGGLAGFYFRQQNKNYLQLMLSFSGAYIIGITAVHLIPETFASASPTLGLWVLIGFFGQLILDQFSSGVEHGHIHAAHEPSTNFVVKIMIGLCTHSLVEGLPLNNAITDHLSHNHQQLFWGIVLHEIPAAFTLTSLLLISNFKRSTVIGCMILYASMSSIGALLGTFFQGNTDSTKILYALVIGTFLHISTTILFETDNNQKHHISWAKLGAIAVGVGLALVMCF
jgi:zinc transporter ZupT